jgi:hypothetical protein
MDKFRTQLNEIERKALDELKDEIESVILHLKGVGVRPANIQIELEWHIKNLLKGD